MKIDINIGRYTTKGENYSQALNQIGGLGYNIDQLPMETRRFSIEHVLYLLAFVVAVLLRVLHLGVMPLSEYEADWALSALRILQGNAVVLEPQPIYTTFTSLLFFLFGDQEAVSRLLPAVFGSLLVLLPYFLQKMIGKRAALLLAFGMAIDPGLVAVSRLAGGPMPALMLSLFAWVAWLNGSFYWTAVLAGLALLSGPAILVGLSTLVPLLLIGFLFPGLNLSGWYKSDSLVEKREGTPSAAVIFVVCLVTVLGVSTLFMLNPSGLGAFARTLPEYARGWIQGTGTPIVWMLVALAVYQPLALFFGVLNSFRSWRDHDTQGRVLSVWAVSALVLSIIYPGRHAADLIWVLFPLWVLAAREMDVRLFARQPEWRISLVQAGLIFLLLILTWLNLATITPSPADQRLNLFRWLLLLGVVGLAIVATLLVGLGWSRLAAMQGLSIGLSVGFVLVLLAGSWIGARSRQEWVATLWQPLPWVGEVDHLLDSLSDFSEWRTGRTDSLDILALNPTAGQRWALRKFQNLTYSDLLLPNQLPSVIISSHTEPEPQQAVAYRGQDFSWTIYPDWKGLLPENWTRWLLYRQAPVRQERVILWMRSDVFPGGEIIPSGEIDSSLQPEEDDLEDILIP